jgi:hypothetical protein
VRRRLTALLAAVACAWIGTGVGVVMAIAWWVAGADGWRQGNAGPLVLDILLLAAALAAALGVGLATRRRLSPVRVAEAMEVAARLPAGSVRGALELGRSLPPGVSLALARKAGADACGALTGSDADLGGALSRRLARWGRWGLGSALAAAVLAAGLAALSPPRAVAAWGGLLRPVSLAVAPELVPLQVRPGTVEVPRGSRVEVVVEAPGRAVAYLDWQAAGDVAVRDTLALADGAATRTFEAVSAPVDYRVTTPDGAATPRHRLVPVDPVFLAGFTLEVTYPPHTGLPPAAYRGSVPPLVLPEGSRLAVEGAATRPLHRAALLDADGEEAVRFAVSGAGFTGAWRPAASGRFRWRLVEPGGDGVAGGPDPLDLTLVPDSAPTVSVPSPGADALLPLSMAQPLAVQARDDFGLARLELVAYRVTASGMAGEPRVQGVELGGARAVLVRPVLDLASWGLLPGDEVRYFARVRDNGAEGRWGRSGEYALRVPRVADLRRDAAERLDSVARRVEELASEAERQARGTRDLGRRLEGAAASRAGRETLPGAPGGAAGYGEREEARQALERQEALAAAVEGIRSELEALARAMEDAAASDPGLTADLRELQSLLEGLSGEGLEAALGELARAVQREDANGTRRSLETLAGEQEAVLRRLETSLERFQRAAVDQDFRSSRTEAEALARAERALADALRAGDRPELRARQQEQLAGAALDLDTRLRQLEERLARLGEGRAAEKVSGARQEALRGAEGMARAGTEAGRDRGASADAADRAAGSMEEAGRQLADAQEEMAEARHEASLRALWRAADEALALARRQAALGEGMGAPTPQARASLPGDVAALGQGVRNLLQALHAGTGGALPQGPQVAARAGRALEALEATAQALAARRVGAPAPQAVSVRAVAALNELALSALAGAEALSGSGEGGAGEQDVRQRVEDVARQQGGLVNQAGELTPLQLGGDALGEQLRRLAQGQESVARQLGDLAGQREAQERSLADLEAMAAEAQALADALAMGRMTPETQQRQERLFHRLLDAGRGLRNENQDPSTERESQAPGTFARPDTPPLGEHPLGGLRYRVPGPDELQSLPPALRQMVIQYFERLNRGGG